MKKLAGAVLLLLILFGTLAVALAQEEGQGSPPPKILVVYREYLKPGKAGSAHEKTESAFVQAMTRAKWPTRYLAADSLSGRPRTLFFNGYDSFADWEKDHAMMMKNPALQAALDHASAADGELLSETDQGVMKLNEEQSLNASSIDIAHMRGFETYVYHVRPGHRQEWNELVKLVLGAYSKVPDVHFVVYELLFGAQENLTYVVYSPFKSGADLDDEPNRDKAFRDALGEDGLKRLGELESSAIQSTATSLLIFNPAISYPRDEWIKADPDFWKPKAAKPKAPTKPEANPPSGN